VQKAKAPASTISTEVLQKTIAQLPAGRLQGVLLEALSNVSMPSGEKTSSDAKALWITWLNMTVSVIGYYVLKSPLLLIRRLRKGKD
jgi:hypothetical protein